MNTCDDFMLELLFTVTNRRIYTYNTTLHNRLGLKIKIKGINKSDRIRYTEHLNICFIQPVEGQTRSKYKVHKQ